MIGNLLMYIHKPNKEMEQYAKEMVDVFLSRFSENKMDMLLKNSLDEYKRILLSILNGDYNYEYVKLYGAIHFNIIKELSKDFYKECGELVERLDKIFVSLSQEHVKGIEYMCETYTQDKLKHEYEVAINSMLHLIDEDLVVEICKLWAEEQAQKYFKYIYIIEKYEVSKWNSCEKELIKYEAN